ncbi:MAG: DUF3592 domain-containing protein [Gammaproteobacteria bacterium]|jgi:hypothetical protein
MFNPYSIILGLFVVAGLLATLWGLRVIVMARKTLQWPAVAGTVEESKISTESSEINDLLPHIKFCYSIEQQTFHQVMQFPGDITPSQEFSRSYVDKYPVGASVQVYYNPEDPEKATLEPGLAKGDWLILAIGLGMVVIGVLLFFFAA